MKRVLLLGSLLITSIHAAEPPLVGVVTPVFGSAEISVVFQEPVSSAALLDVNNYDLGKGQIVQLRLAATNRGVILSTANLPLRSSDTLTITGITDTAFTTDINVGDRSWNLIGGNELGFNPDVLAVGTNGFDLFSGGIQQFDDYDEATFVHHIVAGDFDEVVRVHWVDPAGAGAKAGIMIRENLDYGVGRPIDPEDPSTMFSRYIELSVSAPQSADNQNSGGSHKIFVRPTRGAAELISLTVTNDAPPAFSNAWLRVQRVGAEFKMYRGTNGTTWEQIGSATFPTAAPPQLYAGLAFSPQNDDLFSGDGLRNLFVAKFRDYSSTNENTFITIARGPGANEAQLSWPDEGWTLESTTSIPGTWETVTPQSNPHVVTINRSEPARFYRLRR